MTERKRLHWNKTLLLLTLLFFYNFNFISLVEAKNSSIPLLTPILKGFKKQMGNVIRMIRYDHTINQKNAVSALNFIDDQQQQLKWFRLDDGVMGGQSETNHVVLQNGYLHFCGIINTNGGGFCSIRANLPQDGLPSNTKAIRIKYIGDGKTYKLLLSDGTRGFSTPSWQHDIITSSSNKQEQVIDIQLNNLKASMGPRKAPSNVKFDISSIKEIGFMLSLKLSNGNPNPIETFGTGIFPFSFQIHSIEPIPTTTSTTTTN